MFHESLIGYSSTLKTKVISFLTLAFFLISTFINPSFLHAQIPIMSHLPKAIEMPKHIGNVRDAFHGKGNAPLIIHVQDAHANYEAQKNITNILQVLHTQFDIDTIFMEGSSGEVNTSLFRAFPFAEEKKKIIDAFVKTGKISAPEEYAIIAKEPVQLIGVDHEDMYLENVETYVEATRIQDAAQGYLSSLDTTLTSLRKKLFSDELLHFVKKEERFLTQENDPLEYTRFLIELTKKYAINLKKYKRFSQLVDLEIYQKKINPKEITRETQALIDTALIPVISEEDSDRLAFAELDYKSDRLSPYRYYSFLKELSLKHDIDFRTFVNMNLYLLYLSLVEDIDARKLMDERVAIEKKLTKKICTGAIEKELLTLMQHFNVLKNIFTLKAIPEDLRYFEKHEKEFRNETFETFIKKHKAQGSKLKAFSIEKHLPTFKKF